MSRQRPTPFSPTASATTFLALGLAKMGPIAHRSSMLARSAICQQVRSIQTRTCKPPLTAAFTQTRKTRLTVCGDGLDRTAFMAIVPVRYSDCSRRLFTTTRCMNATGQPSTSSSSTSAAQKACAKCGTAAELNTLSCGKCGALQPLPSELDAYQLLGLEIEAVGSNGWDVDTAELKALWRKRVALSHPDRMGGRDEKEQQIAEQQSAMINKAYETLRDPLQRAHLLLEKHASSAPSEAESLEDPEVLMEVMELREGLEDATTEDDAEAVRKQNQARMDETIAHLQQAFAQDPPDVDAARDAAVGLRYWANIDKAAREWQPGKRVELQH